MVTKQILKQYFINFFLKKKKGVHFQEFNFFFFFKKVRNCFFFSLKKVHISSKVYIRQFLNIPRFQINLIYKLFQGIY